MTVAEYGARQLCVLAEACEYDRHEIAAMLRALRVATESWGSRSVEEMPRWSAVTDDCSPFEFSLAIESGSTELRVLVEPQRDPASPESYWTAGLELARRLRSDFGAAIDRLELVSDLFRPGAEAYFSTFYGIVFRSGERPLFKLYLNPKARGPQQARSTISSALARLGHPQAALRFESLMRPDDEYQFLCLDLVQHGDARTKIYIRHRRSTVDKWCAHLEQTDPRAAADARVLCGAILEGEPRRPPVSMYTLKAEADEISGCAAQLPTFYSSDTGATLHDRVIRLLTSYGLPTSLYVRSVEAFAGPSPSDQVGMHNYVSVQRPQGAPRVTVYLCPRVYLERLGPIGFDPQVTWPNPVNNWEWP
jgi:Tryptophan dimethylallyltransferase